MAGANLGVATGPAGTGPVAVLAMVGAMYVATIVAFELIHALAPGLGMPGYARVWGAGAGIFLALAAVIWLIARDRA
ncbi:MAG: hypothetical protein L6R19_17920 [Alphaproteobacteria bacterium]|nr:hypothetical protein [Alphaproteobacteria bacterium]